MVVYKFEIQRNLKRNAHGQGEIIKGAKRMPKSNQQGQQKLNGISNATELAAFGVVTALHARQRTGKGQNVESSLTNGLISMMAYLSAEYFVLTA